MFELPRKVVVRELIKGRYQDELKPLKWDERISGFDLIIDSNGNHLKLESEGDQSSPSKNWQILLTGQGSEPNTFKWTLYGMG